MPCETCCVRANVTNEGFAFYWRNVRRRSVGNILSLTFGSLHLNAAVIAIARGMWSWTGPAVRLPLPMLPLGGSHAALYSSGQGVAFLFYFTLFQLFSLFSLLYSCPLLSSFSSPAGREEGSVRNSLAHKCFRSFSVFSWQFSHQLTHCGSEHMLDMFEGCFYLKTCKIISVSPWLINIVYHTAELNYVLL
jgi:hypothetical protein